MISILVPTRRRRASLLRTIQSAHATAQSGIEIVCYVDEDDQETYRDVPDARVIIGPRIVLSNIWNKCAEAAIGDIFMQGNDDIVFRTPGWDSMVENAFGGCADKILMVHGSDGSRGNASSTGGFGPHPFVHRKWADTVGYFTPPFFSSDYGDTWLNDVANALGRRTYLPFVVDHMHYLFGKADMDETTKERLDRHSADGVDQLYRDLGAMRQVDIEKLKAVMQ